MFDPKKMLASVTAMLTISCFWIVSSSAYAGVIDREWRGEDYRSAPTPSWMLWLLGAAVIAWLVYNTIKHPKSAALLVGNMLLSAIAAALLGFLTAKILGVGFGITVAFISWFFINQKLEPFFTSKEEKIARLRKDYGDQERYDAGSLTFREYVELREDLQFQGWEGFAEEEDRIRAQNRPAMYE